MKVEKGSWLWREREACLDSATVEGLIETHKGMSNYFKSIIDSPEIKSRIEAYRGKVAFDFVRSLDESSSAFSMNVEKAQKWAVLTIKMGTKALDDVFYIDREAIVDSELDEMIHDRNSLRTALTYIHSGKLLPRPDKTNSEGYENFAVEHLKSLYGITKELKLEDAVLLLSARDKIKEAAECLNAAKDERVKTFDLESILTDGTIKHISMRASESKNPLDYNGNTQRCEHYLPLSSFFIVGYCTDKNAVLVRYEVDGKTLGSAICYHHDNVFLVDSVEGNGRFTKKYIFQAVFNDLIQRAKDLGTDTVIFNNDVDTDTSAKFSEFAARKCHLHQKMSLELNNKCYLKYEEYCNGDILKL